MRKFHELIATIKQKENSKGSRVDSCPLFWSSLFQPCYSRFLILSCQVDMSLVVGEGPTATGKGRESNQLIFLPLDKFYSSIWAAILAFISFPSFFVWVIAIPTIASQTLIKFQ